MNINPTSAAASVAGTSRAAAKGGETDKQAVDATGKQSAAENPGGKSSESNALDAGDQAGDRGGDGRQVLDVFEHPERRDSNPQPAPDEAQAKPAPDGHLDFEA